MTCFSLSLSLLITFFCSFFLTFYLSVCVCLSMSLSLYVCVSLCLSVSLFLSFSLSLSLSQQSFAFAVAGENLTARLRVNSFRAMLQQEIGWHDMESNSTGFLVTRLSRDAADVQGVSEKRFKGYHLLRHV